MVIKSTPFFSPKIALRDHDYDGERDPLKLEPDEPVFTENNKENAAPKTGLVSISEFAETTTGMPRHKRIKEEYDHFKK